jgi:serine/threonine protein kinase
VQINNESSLELLRSEIENLHVLNSEFNVLWHEDITVNLQTYTLQIFMDYFPLGDLDAFIKAHPYGKKRIPKASIGQIMSGLSWGLLDCHSKGILHGDIKPQNSKLLISSLSLSGNVVVEHCFSFRDNGMPLTFSVQLQAGKYQEFDLVLGRLSNFCINSLSEIKNPREEKERDSPRINGTISYLAPVSFSNYFISL